jgi:hypothetical protein
MPGRFRGLALAATLAGLLATPQAAGGQEPAAAAPRPAPHFAVLFRTGPSWDSARPPQEQAFFKEHSANLKRLRETGVIALGARYADVGLIVVTAADEAEARGYFAQDASVKGGTFAMEVHPFSPFYGGCVGQPPKKAP